MKPFFVAVVFAAALLYGCASDSTSSESPSPKAPKTEAKGTSAPASGSGRQSGTSSAEPAAASAAGKREDKFTGRISTVTTTLSNEDVIEGSLSSSLLSQLALQLDDFSRKDSENVSLMITYLGVLRLYGQNPQLYQSLVSRTGPYGAKNFWFLLESSFGALKRKEYGLAEYLFGKAEKLAKEPAERQALAHAEGVRLLLLNKNQSAVVKLREATRGDSAYLPATLTLGFMALRYGDFDGAERNFRLAAAVNPNGANARLGLACALRMKGKNDEAREALLPLTKTRPREKRVLWNYALILADVPATQQEAIAILKSYQESPQPMPELDGKAQALLSRLTLPPPAPPAAPAAEQSKAAPPSAPDKKPPEATKPPAPTPSDSDE